MSDYKRTSQICTFFQIELILQAAIQQEAAYHGCGQIPADILICLETTSQHKQAGIFTRLKNKVTGLPAPGAIQQCAAVITPEWLIWAFTHWDRNDEATALAVRLAEAEISDYAFEHLAPDHGLNILGFVNGATERTLKFLGLGPQADAEQFKQVLQQAVQKARL
jgi:hypothetical protein